MNKTANFQLTQWEKTDRIMMEDFNRDNAAIDAALKSNADKVAAETAAREESQTGRPTIPPQASGVLIDLFIHDLSKARRGAGFPNRRPVLPRFARDTC